MSTIDHERRRRARQMAEARWAFRFHLPIYLIVNAALVIIWFFTGPSNFPWPVFPIFFWGIGVFAHYMAANHNPGGGWLDRETEKILKEEEGKS
ncbi:MAG: hypothetical protein AUF79_04515 [Crenarchaeota archaeon 13_1_20CM_2_51_8]|nr:MAG: hypothetical protein AUF79_04515 [Crenarchaeota archaeon 13_1_20CM_2_51_8]